MNVVTDWTAAARRRTIANDIALGTPVMLVAATTGWRFYGSAGALAALLVTATLLLAVAWRRARRFDRAWLTAALDAQRADLEDSSDLLFVEDTALSPLQRLQRNRLRQRLAAAPLPDLRAPWSTRAIATGWAAALVAVAAILLIAPRPDEAALAPGAEGLPAIAGVPRLTGQQLVVIPPAYTGLPVQRLATLAARVPQGSRLVWRLRFSPAPAAGSLAVVGQSPQRLTRSADEWTAARIVDRSLVYRIVASGAERQLPPLHRIDVIADQPPRVRILTPAQTLTPAAAGQRNWSLAFEASDDHGLAPVAQLRLVLAQGEGENVSFRERIVPITGSGPRADGGRTRLFRTTIDLAAAGFTGPGDLVAQLIVRDNRAPAPQQVRGPSLILRRAGATGGQDSGLEASVKRALPAYFTSQRQIIIDAEALIAERRRVPPDRFLSRSDGIGADQRLLRLRYGQFMGEETGGGATTAMPTNDDEEGKADHDDHPPAPTAPVFGSAMDVTADYGHTHDESEAATLLDPGTRATLRQALDNMWQSELALRQGEPARALPYAYKALRFIKQVQQATRIFLARVGPEQPPIDQTRRLTGKRDGIASSAMPALGERPVGIEPAATWRALAGRGAVDLSGLSRWLAVNEARVPDPLGLTAAIDAVRRAPDCAACRQRLRASIWTALPRPAAVPTRRSAGNAAARRYLEALR